MTVDPHDRATGTAPKLDAHQSGLRHRALSVFVFHPDGALLLQKRAPEKYHSAGLWSNTCCTHPRVGETVDAAAHRRLQEEMGFDCALQKAFVFTYRTDVGALTEHEVDHVFVGHAAPTPDPNAAEVADWAWASVSSLRTALNRRPEDFTAWFCLLMNQPIRTYASASWHPAHVA